MRMNQTLEYRGAGMEIRLTDPHRHKYDSAMAELLDMLDDDEATGSTEWAEYVQRFGKRLLFTDDRGFVTCERWESVDAARARFDEIDAAYGVWLDTDDDEPTDILAEIRERSAVWCELHNRPHVMGGLACEQYGSELIGGTD